MGYGGESAATNIEWVRSMVVHNHIAGSGLYAIVSIGMAMLLALHGLGWNNYQNKVDLYQSVPVKLSMRFWYIHLNSLLIFGISLGVNMLLANAAAAVKGIWYGGFLKASVLCFFMYLLLFLAAYFLIAIAQSLTGNIVLGLFGGGFLLLLEPICYFIRNELQELFYQTYMAEDAYQVIAKGIFSPLAPFVGMYKTVSTRYYSFARSANFSGIGKFFILFLLQIIVYGMIAYLLYKKRPAQMGGKMMLFPKSKPVIKCIIMICGSLFTGILIEEVSGKTTLGYGFAGVVFGLIVCQVILQTIMEGDFKEITKGKLSFAAAAVISIVLYLTFALDITGFDTYLPKEEQLESFAFVRSGDYCYDYMDENENYCSSIEYLLEHMAITDEDAKKQMLDMLKQEIDSGEYYYSDADEIETAYPSDEENEQNWVYVKMRLAGGKEILRQYYLNQESVRAYWKNLYEQPEYKEAIYAMLGEDNREKMLTQENKKMNVSVTYTGYVMGNSDVVIEDGQIIEKLFDAMKADVETRTADTVMQEIPVGVLYFFCYDTVQGQRKVDFHMPVYADDRMTTWVLQEEGYYRESGINQEDIAAIVIERSDGKELTINIGAPLFEAVVDDLIISDALEYVSDYSLIANNNYWADVAIKTNSGDSNYSYEYNFRLNKAKFPEALKTAFEQLETEADED
jgi:hypothetical protein